MVSYYGDEDFVEYEAPDELALKLRELVTEEVKSKITETVESLENAKKTIESLSKRNSELQSKVNRHSGEIKDAIRDRDLEYRREISGGYIVGDKFYYAETRSARELCKPCTASGKVKAIVAGLEITIKCPECGGEGKKHQWVFEPVEDTVASVHISFHERGKSSRATHYGQRGGSSERMSEKMKKTLEECQAWCDAKNAENKKVSA